MNRLLAPAWLIAANLAFFCLLASYFLSRRAQLSHHWIFALLEGTIFTQAALFRNPRLLKTLIFLSLTVLSFSLLRIETIYLSRHMIHFTLAWTVAVFVHLKLRKKLERERLFERGNAWLACGCALIAAFSLGWAIDRGIWFGIGAGN